MAKLTVFYKFKAIETYPLENGIVYLGRDEIMGVAINKLGVASAHAAVIVRGDLAFAHHLSDNFPLIVNREKIKECDLHNNDMISVGQYDIIYNTADNLAELEKPSVTDVRQNSGEAIVFSKACLDLKLDGDTHAMPVARLQMLNGNHIGKIIQLKKRMMPLGVNGTGMVMIVRKKEGYYVSVLENKGPMAVNDVPLESRVVKLENNDIITVNMANLQFFTE